VWGTAGLAYCDSITGFAFARIETKLRNISRDDEADAGFGGIGTLREPTIATDQNRKLRIIIKAIVVEE